MNVKFVFIGHVDAGKSTVSGHLLYKAGHVDTHTLESMKARALTHKRKGCEFAYLLDSGEEEQANNRTVDYDLVSFPFNDREYTLVDCPGHQAYVRNLIQGLNATDPSTTIGCLVISLANGEYEAGMQGGQTQEAVILLRAVGIQDLIVVMNKIDLVPVGSERYVKIEAEQQQHLKKLGFRNLTFHPVSAYQGEGLVELLGVLGKVSDERLAVTAANEKKEEEAVMVEGTQLSLLIRLMYTTDYSLIFSAGLGLMMHIGAKEHQVIIEALVDAKTKKRLVFAGNGAVLRVKVSCEEGLRVTTGARVILRKDDHTIGFGVVKG